MDKSKVKQAILKQLLLNGSVTIDGINLLLTGTIDDQPNVDRIADFDSIGLGANNSEMVKVFVDEIFTELLATGDTKEENGVLTIVNKENLEKQISK